MDGTYRRSDEIIAVALEEVGAGAALQRPRARAVGVVTRQETLASCTTKHRTCSIMEEESDRREDKGRSCWLGEGIDSIAWRNIDLAPGCEEMDDQQNGHLA